ncbi:MAG: PEGA domain-containing protein [Methanoregula sp.]|nr:PEGA domain-containing protein [Methanoregula sp.]
MSRIPSKSTIPFLIGMLLICLMVLPSPVTAGTAWFDIKSNPSGAWACVDGYLCENTPIIFAQEDQSDHAITVYMDGYEMYREYTGTGSDGTTTYIYADLVRNTPSDGWLNIDTDAYVTIDGVAYGNAMLIPLSPGSHNLLLQKAGYDDYTTTFVVTDSQTTYLSPGMTKSATSGSLQIDSTPAGAAVYVNGDYQGNTQSTLYVTQLSPGTYSLRFSMPDYQTVTQTAVVQAGIINDIRVDMVPVTPGPTPDTTGQINVGSSPQGAAIWLDSKLRGITPMILADIPSGSHAITLKMNGYQDWSSTVNVEAGSYEEISGTLSPGSQPTPTAKSPLSLATIIAAIGISGAVLLARRKQ